MTFPAPLPTRPSRTTALATASLTGAMLFLAFFAAGGLRLGRVTTVEVLLVVGASLVSSAVFLVRPAGSRQPGTVAIVSFAAFALLSALSVTWSVGPSESWIEANRTFAWFAAFAGAAGVSSVSRRGWQTVLASLLLFGITLSLYAIATKVLPAQLNPDETYARLREPYGYWNSVGLTAAMTLPCCLWLGARRHGHQAVNALAYPATAICVFVILLAYSRGALLAVALACALWFAVVPLRLRGMVVLAVGTSGGLILTLWAFGQSALTDDRVSLGLRQTAGWQLGVLLIAVLTLVLATGLAIGFLTARRAPRRGARQTLATAILVIVLLFPAGGVGILATSDKGLGGSISSGWKSLTDPAAVTPANDPSRLTAVGSVRARYWNEAIKAFEDHTLAGVGAGGYEIVRTRYRTDELDVLHAHGYVVQVLSDLGLLGVGLTLALFLSWWIAAARACGLGRRGRRSPWPPERVGLATMFAVVVAFGVHSLVDWTWYVPGNAVPALLVAGWLAGRGAIGGLPHDVGPLRAAFHTGMHDRRRVASVAVVMSLALLTAWTIWQPFAGNRTEQDALAALDKGNPARAAVLASKAIDINPLSVDSRFTLATIRMAEGNTAGARRAYTDAVQVQPRNPRPWLELARFELSLGDRAAARRAIGPALYLDPKSPEAGGLYLETQSGAAAAVPGPAGTSELTAPAPAP